ncbi:uncharacterized protein BXIN_2785 [Babesia sp. Xinjiang]|uniref:uncharacterized protein n=1 Tax=Babesia sp. Xinjiang TaxID=462227 RepID=UPI000A2205C5|nr:uncharacterized protein BXIN_2785 [Babesia sp. Xinjiang]ORM41747.1 hypothetical protein BXIN_2785 [Babesia sp. Xinjiang]
MPIMRRVISYALNGAPVASSDAKRQALEGEITVASANIQKPPTRSAKLLQMHDLMENGRDTIAPNAKIPRIMTSYNGLIHGTVTRDQQEEIEGAQIKYNNTVAEDTDIRQCRYQTRRSVRALAASNVRSGYAPTIRYRSEDTGKVMDLLLNNVESFGDCDSIKNELERPLCLENDLQVTASRPIQRKIPMHCTISLKSANMRKLRELEPEAYTVRSTVSPSITEPQDNDSSTTSPAGNALHATANIDIGEQTVSPSVDPVFQGNTMVESTSNNDEKTDNVESKTVTTRQKRAARKKETKTKSKRVTRSTIKDLQNAEKLALKNDDVANNDGLVEKTDVLSAAPVKADETNIAISENIETGETTTQESENCNNNEEPVAEKGTMEEEENVVTADNTPEDGVSSTVPLKIDIDDLDTHDNVLEIELASTATPTECSQGFKTDETIDEEKSESPESKPKVGRGKYKRTNKRKKGEGEAAPAKATKSRGRKTVINDVLFNALHDLNLCRLNTPIPSQVFDIGTEEEIVITGSLDEHELDCNCCDSELLDMREFGEPIGPENVAFFSKCHLCINPQGTPCWCCCYIDFFGSFAQKRFVVDVFGFEMAEGLARRSRENAEMIFHMLWMQQNKKLLDCNIPQNASMAVLQQYAQLKHVIMRIDRMGFLASQMRRAIRL